MTRPVESLSVISTRFCHWKEPNRSGVVRLSVVSRLRPVRPSVSTPVSAPGTVIRRSSGVLNDVWLLIRRSGDQVTDGPKSSGLGLSVRVGKLISPLPSLMFCRRLPPTVRFPQEYRLVKLALLEMCWVVSRGSTELRATIDELVT